MQCNAMQGNAIYICHNIHTYMHASIHQCMNTYIHTYVRTYIKHIYFSYLMKIFKISQNHTLGSIVFNFDDLRQEHRFPLFCWKMFQLDAVKGAVLI